jgi:DNA segregation ATPase FtsK/SpoIIIE, S-DNA-T family
VVNIISAETFFLLGALASVGKFAIKQIKVLIDSDYIETKKLIGPITNEAAQKEIQLKLIDSVKSYNTITLSFKIYNGKYSDVEKLQKEIEFKTGKKVFISHGKETVKFSFKYNSNKILSFMELYNKSDLKNYKLPWVVGVDENGNTLIRDIAEAPHILLAGTTGGGKSISLNTLILSLMLSCSNKDIEFIMIDPKQIELNFYSDINFLKIPIIREIEETRQVLNDLIQEMNKRYKLMAEHKVKSIENLYKKTGKKFKTIIVLFDEFGDFSLMDTEKKTSKNSIQNLITLLAQKARASSIHLIMATQKPVDNIISTAIKANITERVAFITSNGNESRLIIDKIGAENLNGKGDMIYKTNNKLLRCQGAFVDENEIEEVCKLYE